LTETGKLFLNELNSTWSDLQNAVNLVTRDKKTTK
jgi:PadR family transcriptional regulator PadR